MSKNKNHDEGRPAPENEPVPGANHAEQITIARMVEEQEQMRIALSEAHGKLSEVEAELAGLLSDTLVYGTVLSKDHKIDPTTYAKGERVCILDEDDKFFGRVADILSDNVDLENGTIRVQVFGQKASPHYRIGLPDKGKSQVILLSQNDGSNIKVAIGGNTIECWNQHRFDPKPGDTAKVHHKTNQVVTVGKPEGYGSVCPVLEVYEDTAMVEVDGNKKLVCVHIEEGAEKLQPSDRLVLDRSNTVAVKHIPNSKTSKFKVKSEQNKVSWNEIGGQVEAKSELIEALVFPHQFPDLFQFYNMDVPAGILLFGPPGCGKTMLAKAAAHTLAEIHEKEAVTSGFNYVKGPEMLSKWVGETESEIRGIFHRMRQHYERHGYPCVTFLDEADSVFTERGSHGEAVWHDTAVAQWLSEMDGFDRKSGILILATNRQKSLDGAITRPGRIDRHIKIRRPNREDNSAQQVFRIHLQGVPLTGTDVEEVANLCVDDLTSTEKPLYKIGYSGKSAIFHLADCLSGAMIASVVAHAKTLAMRRDLKILQENRKSKKDKAKPEGVNMDDFKMAISTIYLRNLQLAHKFDVEDFLESRGCDPATANPKIERLTPQSAGK